MATRISMLLTAAALMALMMVASAAPAMANNLFNNDNDLDHFGVLNANDVLDNDLFDHGRRDHLGLFDRDDDEDLDTIRVGDLRCLVEDGDDVEFCVNKDTGQTFRV
jgi:hypothetical protein